MVRTQWMPPSMPEPGLVVLRVKRPGPVEIDSGARVGAAHGHQMEQRRLRRLATLHHQERTGSALSA